MCDERAVARAWEALVARPRARVVRVARVARVDTAASCWHKHPLRGRLTDADGRFFLVCARMCARACTGRGRHPRHHRDVGGAGQDGGQGRGFRQDDVRVTATASTPPRARARRGFLIRPPNNAVAWSDSRVERARRFLDRHCRIAAAVALRLRIDRLGTRDSDELRRPSLLLSYIARCTLCGLFSSPASPPPPLPPPQVPEAPDARRRARRGAPAVRRGGRVARAVRRQREAAARDRRVHRRAQELSQPASCLRRLDAGRPSSASSSARSSPPPHAHYVLTTMSDTALRTCTQHASPVTSTFPRRRKTHRGRVRALCGPVCAGGVGLFHRNTVHHASKVPFRCFHCMRVCFVPTKTLPRGRPAS